MKKYIVFTLSLFWMGCFSQSININTTTYTVPELVTKILVNKTCVPVSNITWRTGNTNGFDSSNGIGYFENTNPNFPLSNGVILSTGDVKNAIGPNTSQLNDGNTSWSGDDDLEATLLAAGIEMNSTNATVLEFDFIPFSSNFDFNFLFASEEYGNFQCQFSDAFAFLLTNNSTKETTNLAVVPNTNIPISVVTIRDALYNTSCSSENPSYFGNFNGGSDTTNSATNFNGQTITMSASSTSLIPNTSYHIKLVIADRKDNKADSAIFLGANSFNVGQDVLGPDLTIANNNAICNDGEKTLVSGLDPKVYSFAWTYNGNPTGENTANLIANKPGIYGLTYSIITSACPVTTDFITVEFFNPIITPNPVDLFQCNSGEPNSTFDLTLNTTIVTDSQTKISYHSSNEDALLNNNPLPNNYTVSNTSLPSTVWARIMNTTTNCSIIKTFQLGTTPKPIANNPADLILCETTAGTNTATFDIASQTATILGEQPANLYDVSYYYSNTGVNPIDTTIPLVSGNSVIFARVQNKTDTSCYSLVNFNLTVIPKAALDQIPDQFVCNSYTLPPHINPGNYYSGPNQGLPMLNVGDIITTDKTVYIYSSTAGDISCPQESSFNIKIVSPSEISLNDIISCDQYQLPYSIYGLRYFTSPGGPSGGGTEIPEGTILTTPGTTTIHSYFSSTDIANLCVFENQFNITINITPKIVPIANVFDCTSYNLPPLTVGDYYTLDISTGIYTPITSTVITSTTTLYVFATNNTCRTPDTIFTVYINSLGIENKIECQSYNLPPAPVGEYRDAPNGGGNIIPPGSISKTSTIYTYVPRAGSPNCTDDDFFTITINAPFLATPSSVATCASYTLPIQENGGDYYTLPGGPNKIGNVKLMPNIDVITSTKTVYIFKPSATISDCYNEKPWLITIYQKPKIDTRDNIDQCDSYVLSPLAIGNYFENPNGVNPIPAGTVIKTNKRIYIYATHPNDSSCYSENFFDISINGVQADPIPTQLSYCDSFTFPVLPTPNNFYYDAPGGPFGSGKIIPFGTTVTPKTVLPVYYIFYESGNRLNCTDEKAFSIIVVPNPVANPVNPIETCDTFGSNDGIFEFDLTSLSIRNQILSRQTPDANFTLTFYTSFAAANDINAIPISNPKKYQNDNPFTDSVWIRIANNRVTTACFDVTELKLIVNPLPNPQLDSEYFICEDYATGTLLNPATINTGLSVNNYTFEWTFNGKAFDTNSPSITTSEVGDYSVTITNKLTNCISTSLIKVSKYKPYLEIAYSDAFENPSLITVNVLGAGSGNYEYRIDDSPYQESNQFNNVKSGEHTLSVRDTNGHCDPQPIDSIIINYPKFFTPNGDGYNETWNIPHLLPSNPDAPISIYDRYGNLIQQISPSSQGWNGMHNGTPLPPSDYWFTVGYNEKGISKVFKSHFTLKR